MARLFDNASSQFLSVANNMGWDGGPISISAWFFIDEDAAQQAMCEFFLDDISKSNDYIRLLALMNTGGDPLRYALDGDASVTMDSGNSIQLNEWNHGVLITAADNDHSIILNGDIGNKGTSSTSVTMANINPDTVNVGRRGSPGTPDFYFSGRIAEVTVWNIALKDSEVISLSKGYSSEFVRPQNRIAHWDIYGRTNPEIDLIQRNNLTVTGATAAAHPPIIQPRRAQIHPFTAAVAGGRIMSSLAGLGGLAAPGGIAGEGGGLAG